MFTPAEISSFNAALAHIAANRDALRISVAPGCAAAMTTLKIECRYIEPRTALVYGSRDFGYTEMKGFWQATCGLDHGFNAWTSGHNSAAAFRNLFKMMSLSATLGCKAIKVPMILSYPSEARKQAAAERKAAKANRFADALDRAATALDAEREAAPTIIGPAPELRAVDSLDDSLQMKVGGYSRIVCNNLANLTNRKNEIESICAAMSNAAEWPTLTASTVEIAVAAIGQYADQRGELSDYTSNNDGSIDGWGWDPECDCESEMTWRVCIRITNGGEA